ncbi:MAG: Ig-like domain-containing protein [Myxococcales bacterium]
MQHGRRVALSSISKLAWLAAATLCGCNALFGIGDDDESPGAAGSAGDATSRETGGQAGAFPDAASGQSSSAASSSRGGDPGTVTAGTTGGAGDAGALTTGTAGTGGESPNGQGGATVTGKVENIWGYPLEGVTVTARSANGDSSGVTDASGAFTVDNVATPYEAFFVVDGGDFVEGWSFQGLTRADPIFRTVNSGNGTHSLPQVEATGVDAVAEPFVGFAVGTPYGRLPSGLPQRELMAGDYVYLYGARKADGTAHALSFLADENKLPTDYLGYASHSIHIDTDQNQSELVSLDLSPPDPKLPVDTVSGTVTGGSLDVQVNALWLMFDSNADMLLAREHASDASFSYQVPALPDGAAMVTVAVGGWGSDALAIGYRAGLQPGQSGIELVVPPASSPTLPEADAYISADTSFSWEAPVPVSVLLVDQIVRDEIPRLLHVVTAQASARIPQALFEGMGFDPDQSCHWMVETHGDFDGVDATASDAGFLTAFSENGEPMGPLRPDGAYTRSRQVRCSFSP